MDSFLNKQEIHLRVLLWDSDEEAQYVQSGYCEPESFDSAVEAEIEGLKVSFLILKNKSASDIFS